MDPNKDTLRVLVATDSHLGFMEKDELRRHDSFNSFDEVCAIAAEKEVDFMLLGGDLFHENKPSRTTLVKTIEILRRYCLNDRPVQFQVVSDQTINFPTRYGHVNYEDPHYNVGLPVDLGGNGVGQIVLHPILIQKGSTKVALYGLGNIRDERLNRMFQVPHAVQWIRPASQEDCAVSDWFNLFVIHQNRVKSNPKNAVNEHFLAQFLDLVIWGHEHECLVDPQEVPGMGFHVTQPGSSVATALTEGEAAPKHVLLIEIKGRQYRPTKIPLQSVRPFLFADVCLKDDPDVDPNDQDSVLEFLTKKVEEMISTAPKGTGKDGLQVPLIRLRVDYTGSTTINPQRFGQKFVGKVANPNDILLFTKAAKARRAKGEEGDEPEEALGLAELNQQNIEALVAESNLKMEILPVDDLGVALHEFVNKDEKQAFHVCVQDNLEKTQTTLAEEGAETLKEEKDVMERVTLHMRQREAEGAAKRGAAKPSDATTSHPTAQSSGAWLDKEITTVQSSLRDMSDDEEMLGPIPIPAATGKKPQQVTGRGRSAGKAVPESSSGRGTTGRGRGRGSRGGGRHKQTTLNFMGTGAPQTRTSSAKTPLSSASLQISSDDEEPATAEDPDVVLDESESEPSETVARGRKRGTRGRGRGSQPPAKRGRKSAATKVASYIEDDVEDDDDDEDYAMPSSHGRGGTSQGTRRSWGALRR
ncbi:unnamed protein product [Calypogeia fissa]